MMASGKSDGADLTLTENTFRGMYRHKSQARRAGRLESGVVRFEIVQQASGDLRAVELLEAINKRQASIPEGAE